MNPTLAKRTTYVSNVLNLIKTPYIWGGRDKMGVDCWGLPALALYLSGGPKLFDWWTDRAFAQLPTTDGPQIGDLCFYGVDAANPMNVDHVTVWMGGAVVGASGGGSAVTTLAVAQAKGAMVKAIDSYLYRSGFRGFRSMSPYLVG